MKKKATSSSSSPIGSYYDPYGEEDIDPVIYFAGKAYTRKKNIDSILILGIDSYGEAQEREGNNNNDQADVLMVLVVDHKAKTYQVLQVNRDTITEIPLIGTTGDRLGTVPAQIALSHTYGSGLEDSCEYSVEAMETLLMGEDIQHYISLKLDCVAILNRSVGGVEVKIPYDMTMVDPDMKDGATIKLNDKQAEGFVRARQSLENSTNVSRMERQTTYLSAWKDLAKKKMDADATYAINLIGDLGDYMITDMNLDELSKLSSYLADYDYLGMIKIKGENRVGERYMEFYCDDTSLKEAVITLFYDEKV
ncbi:MAG: LCP family protein [Clostridiales bacterium]|nr:LCP family protein [Clostridiales bacterium]